MTARRDRLGKGLGALLGEYLGDSQPTASHARQVQVAEIAPNPYQPRREFSEQDLADLTTSMRENGLLQPILVRPQPGPGIAQWELVAGERRWRASMRLGWKEIPALIRDVDDRTLLVLAMVENLQRSELSALEEAEGYRRLANEFSLSHQQIAELVGKERSTVANSLRLLNLPASVRQLLADGRLTAGHARALLGLNDERRLATIAQAAADEGWSVRAVEAAVQKQRGTRRKAKAAGRARDPNERLLEETLQRVLGTRAKIRHGRGDQGHIEIPYYGVEDFERVFEIVAGRPAADLIS